MFPCYWFYLSRSFCSSEYIYRRRYSVLPRPGPELSGVHVRLLLQDSTFDYPTDVFKLFSDTTDRLNQTFMHSVL